VYGGQERGGIATPDGVPYVFFALLLTTNLLSHEVVGADNLAPELDLAL
jgi:hypothetical protein